MAISSKLPHSYMSVLHMAVGKHEEALEIVVLHY